MYFTCSSHVVLDTHVGAQVPVQIGRLLKLLVRHAAEDPKEVKRLGMDMYGRLTCLY